MLWNRTRTPPVDLGDAWQCRGGKHTTHTPRLELHPLQYRHIPDLVDAANDPTARRMLGIPNWDPNSHTLRDHLNTSVRAQALDPVVVDLTICLRDTGRIIGIRSIIETEPGRFLTGSWITPEHRGQRFGTEALQHTLNLCHLHLGAREILAATAPDNIAAQTMLRNAGMSMLATTHPFKPLHMPERDSVWFTSLNPTERHPHCRHRIGPSTRTFPR